MNGICPAAHHPQHDNQVTSDSALHNTNQDYDKDLKASPLGSKLKPVDGQMNTKRDQKGK
jgi:hypothetical protein